MKTPHAGPIGGCGPGRYHKDMKEDSARPEATAAPDAPGQDLKDLRAFRIDFRRCMITRDRGGIE